jgi:hypothetical protein
MHDVSCRGFENPNARQKARQARVGVRQRHTTASFLIEPPLEFLSLLTVVVDLSQ